MRTLHILLLCTALIAITYADESSGCIKTNNQCIRSSECCTGCCDDGKCVTFNDSCIKDTASYGGGKNGPCDSRPPCPPNQVCVLRQVQCIRSPCPPIPTCVPKDYEDYN